MKTEKALHFKEAKKWIEEYCQSLGLSYPKVEVMPVRSRTAASYDPDRKTIYLPELCAIKSIEHELVHYLVDFILILEMSKKRIEEELCDIAEGGLFVIPIKKKDGSVTRKIR